MKLQDLVHASNLNDRLKELRSYRRRFEKEVQDKELSVRILSTVESDYIMVPTPLIVDLLTQVEITYIAELTKLGVECDG